MKSTVTLGLLFLLLSAPAWSQSDAKIVEKHIEINEGETPKVTIKTTENGTTTITTYTGDAAQDYIDAHGDIDPSKSAHTSRVEVNISDEDIQKMKEKMRAAQSDLEQDLEKLSIELQSMNIDSIMESVGVEVERSMDELRYHFESINGKSASVIVIQGGDEDDIDLDVRVEVEHNDDDSTKEVRVIRKRISVEDHEEKNVGRSQVADLKVYPVPSDGAITLSFNNSGNDPVDIVIRNSEGKVQRQLKVRGDGDKQVKLNLDDLAAGTYFIDIKQGKSQHTKKLILE